jgi:ABC-type nitrate/sulfonate/bicarbonate transport system permease component
MSDRGVSTFMLWSSFETAPDVCNSVRIALLISWRLALSGETTSVFSGLAT